MRAGIRRLKPSLSPSLPDARVSVRFLDADRKCEHYSCGSRFQSVYGESWQSLLQSRVFGFGIFHQRNIEIGIFPEEQKILVSSERPDTRGIGIGSVGS